jgi:hypothetical protein
MREREERERECVLERGDDVLILGKITCVF